MNTWVIVWLVIYAAAALMFFGAALIIAVVGTGDLRDLLSRGEKNVPLPREKM